MSKRIGSSPFVYDDAGIKVLGIGSNDGTISTFIESYPTVSAIPTGFTGTAQVGTQLYVGDGVSLSLQKSVTAKGALFLGTSITAMHNNVGGTNNQIVVTGPESWVHWLLTALKQPFDTVISKGVSGNTTSQMVARYASDVAANYNNFSVLFFEPGPNDHLDSITYETIIANYIFIIESALNAGKTVVLLSITPQDSLNNATMLKRAKIYAWCQTVARKYTNLIYVNTEAVMADPSTGFPLSVLYRNVALETNRVHPSLAGAQVLGRHVARHVSNLFSPSIIAQTKMSDRQYMPNPLLSGNNASGTNAFYVGTSVTGTGPDATQVAIQAGTFTSVVVAPYTNTGLEDNPAGGMLVTCTAAVADYANVRCTFGSNMTPVGGNTQTGGWANGAGAGWSASAVVTVGKMATNAAYPLGIWRYIQGGTTGSTVPAPTSALNYGEPIADGTAKAVWIKRPATGDTFTAEIAYEIKSITGGCTLSADAWIARNGYIDAETSGSAYFPTQTDGTAAMQPTNNTPRIGLLRSSPFTVTEGLGIWYVLCNLNLQFSAGSSAQVYIKEVHLIRQ